MASGSTQRRVVQEDAYVLHTRPYMETSLIVDVFTRRHGRMALIARGARRPRSSLRGLLLAFYPLRLNWSGVSEMPNLTGAEWSGGGRAMQGLALMCGFYLNELLLRLLPRGDAHENLFDLYGQGLEELRTGDDAQGALLRGFERKMLVELGYAPVLDRDAVSGAPVEPRLRYVYEPDRGPVAVSNGAISAWTVSGQTLLDIVQDDYCRAETRDEARVLMRTLIAHRLGGQPLHTRTVLKALQQL